MAFLHWRDERKVRRIFVHCFENGSLTKLKREDGFIVEMRLDPRHEKVDVFRSGDFDGFLDFDAVGPEILVSIIKHDYCKEVQNQTRKLTFHRQSLIHTFGQYKIR